MPKQRAPKHHHHRRRRLAIEAKSVPAPEACSIRAIVYGEGKVIEKKIEQLEELDSLRESGKTLWVDVDGTARHDVLQRLGKLYNIHNLALDDVINQQRPKLVQFKDRFFLVLEELQYDKDLVSRQIC